jgi:hypothetical protein
VRPLFAATSTTGFPDPDAGFSAYIKVDAEKIDLDALTSKFVDMKLAGDNYVVGRYMQIRVDGGWPTEVFVYADTDGWIISYLEDNRLAADAIVKKVETLNWNSALSAVINRAAQDSGAIASSGKIDETDVQYYHWGYPEATNLGIVASGEGGNIYIAVPQNRNIYEISIVMVCVQASGSRGTWHHIGQQTASISCPTPNSHNTYPLSDNLPKGIKSDSNGKQLNISLNNPLSYQIQGGIAYTYSAIRDDIRLHGVAILLGPVRE